MEMKEEEVNKMEDTRDPIDPINNIVNIKNEENKLEPGEIRQEVGEKDQKKDHKDKDDKKKEENIKRHHHHHNHHKKHHKKHDHRENKSGDKKILGREDEVIIYKRDERIRSREKEKYNENRYKEREYYQNREGKHRREEREKYKENNENNKYSNKLHNDQGKRWLHGQNYYNKYNARHPSQYLQHKSTLKTKTEIEDPYYQEKINLQLAKLEQEMEGDDDITIRKEREERLNRFAVLNKPIAMTTNTSNLINQDTDQPSQIIQKEDCRIVNDSEDVHILPQNETKKVVKTDLSDRPLDKLIEEEKGEENMGKNSDSGKSSTTDKILPNISSEAPFFSEERARRESSLNEHEIKQTMDFIKFLNENRENVEKLKEATPQKEIKENICLRNEDPMLDMFDLNIAEHKDLQAWEISQKGFINQSADTFDDAEGYYMVKIGELISGRYKVESIAGKGVFATVVRAKDMLNDKLVAIKILRTPDIYRYSGEKEKTVLHKLNMADKNGKGHCISMVEHFEYHDHLCIVLECLAMNLRETLNKYGKHIGLSLSGVRLYARQLFIALYYMKRSNIVHADIKPDNIMTTDDGKHIYLCDFGSALFPEECLITDVLVSRYYRPPEIILGLPYDQAIDTWSTAVSLFELYTGKVMFPGRNNNEMLKLFMKYKGKVNIKMQRKAQYVDSHFNEQGQFLSNEIDPVSRQSYIKNMSIPVHGTLDLLSQLKAVNTNDDLKDLQIFKDFLDKVLAIDPNKRLSPEDALKHPFLDFKLHKLTNTNKGSNTQLGYIHSAFTLLYKLN